ncbi:MAG: acyl carrier protein [Ruminococcus sp.]|nr:acyl carrier protein [Ruminococcus sp.]
METIDKVKAILAEQLDYAVEDIRDSSDVMGDLGADSLDIVDVVMAIEEEFDIEVPDEDVPLLKSVGDIAAYVDNKKA